MLVKELAEKVGLFDGYSGFYGKPLDETTLGYLNWLWDWEVFIASRFMWLGSFENENYYYCYYYYDDDEEAFIEEVQNQLMLTSEFKNQGAAVVATPAWEKQNSYFGSEFH